jgi:chromosome segregation ATPase
MGKRTIHKAIKGLREQIATHQDKIARERNRPEPNRGSIAHWQQELEAFTIRLRRLEDRLAQRRRRGR